MDLSYTTEHHLHPIARTGENVSLWPILHSLLISRERENKLPLLTPEEAVRLFEEYRRGDFARIQLFWDAMEERDEDMCAVIAARIGGIEDLPPRIEADADAVAADPSLATLAEQQAAHLRTRLAAVANLQEAIAHLAMSDFRGVAALEVCGSPTLQRWEVIEPWCLIRPARRGPWLYNPTATPGAVNGEALDPARVIIAEARAIDLPCMFLLCAKYHSTSGWDAFLDVFGNPSLFLELPPQTTPQMAQEYDAIVRQIIGEGRGTIPSGSKFQTVETGQNSADSFAARAEWCKKALITLALGGTLTMMSESGTGTLAGSAHTDSLTRLITATARRIARAIDTQWAAPILRTAFPGKPILAHFTLRAEEERDTAAAASLLATLAGAGYTVTEEQAEELLGFPVTYHTPAAPQPFTNTDPTDPEPPTDPTDPAPLTNTTDTPAEAAEDTPLTEAELTALRTLTTAPLTNRTNPQQDEEGQGDEGQEEDDDFSEFVIFNNKTDRPYKRNEKGEFSSVDTNGTPGADTQEQTPTTWTEQHLPEVKDWKPIYQERNSPQKAIDEIKATEGIDIQSADGKTIHINGSLLDHWKDKTKGEFNRRITRWEMMKSILANPHEVWIDPKTKQRLYLGRIVSSEGYETISGFTFSDSMELQTYFVPRNEFKLNKMRSGILAYSNHKQK